MYHTAMGIGRVAHDNIAQSYVVQLVRGAATYADKQAAIDAWKSSSEVFCDDCC